MSEHTLLEICLVSLICLPESELTKLLPTLASMAEPYLAQRGDRTDMARRIHHCLTEQLPELITG